MGALSTVDVTPRGEMAEAPASIRLADEAIPETSAFRLYFNDIAGARRMSAAQELRSALDLLRLRRQLWCTITSCSAAMPDVLALLRERLPADHVPIAQVSAVERTGRGLRGEHDEVRRLFYESACAALAEAMVEVDRDHLIAHAIVERAQRLGGTDELGQWASSCHEVFEEIKRARDAFVAANLGLVIAVVRRYERGHLSLLDLIQEGNTGLIRAVDRFDPQRGVRFSTYAVWWIRHAVGRALSDKSREVRLPCHVVERQQAVRRALARFEQKNGRRPSTDELARASGLPAEKVEDLLSVDLERAMGRDRETGAAAPLDVEDLASEPAPLEQMLDKDVLELGLRKAMRKLTPQQIDILRRRFGLDGEEPMTLREVGLLYDLSRERIRQVQNRALATLRREFQRHGMV